MQVQVVTWASHAAELGSIRRHVFIDEQNVPEALEWDGLDHRAFHFLVYADMLPVGCARLLADGHIGRMAVLQDFRGQGAGRALLAAVLQTARQQTLSWLYLNAQTHAAGFYVRSGFQPVGAEFPDAGIPHLRMELVMENHSSALNTRFGLAGKLHFVGVS